MSGTSTGGGGAESTADGTHERHHRSKKSVSVDHLTAVTAHTDTPTSHKSSHKSSGKCVDVFLN
jgi:hypothetical protein